MLTMHLQAKKITFFIKSIYRAREVWSRSNEEQDCGWWSVKVKGGHWEAVWCGIKR